MSSDIVTIIFEVYIGVSIVAVIAAQLIIEHDVNKWVESLKNYKPKNEEK